MAIGDRRLLGIVGVIAVAAKLDQTASAVHGCKGVELQLDAAVAGRRAVGRAMLLAVDDGELVGVVRGKIGLDDAAVVDPRHDRLRPDLGAVAAIGLHDESALADVHVGGSDTVVQSRYLRHIVACRRVVGNKDLLALLVRLRIVEDDLELTGLIACPGLLPCDREALAHRLHVRRGLILAGRGGRGQDDLSRSRRACALRGGRCRAHVGEQVEIGRGIMVRGCRCVGGLAGRADRGRTDRKTRCGGRHRRLGAAGYRG